MKILNNRNRYVEFGSLKCGDVFTDQDEEIWMKTETTYCDDSGDYDNAVRLKDGYLDFFTNQFMVIVLNACLTIE